MRVGDVYRINRMVVDDHDDMTIHERFKNDYPEDEITKFIKSGRAEGKTTNKPAPKKSAKKDPLS